MTTRFVYLVPGFFGFTSLGALNYFYRVNETLSSALDERGVSARIVSCPTLPTGSIRKRALVLLDHVKDTGGHEADEVYFVGHSTGGLDVRLLATPGVRLRPDDLEEQIAARTRSVISVATPHFGTPIASFFNTAFGSQLLELLTLLATTSGGRYSLVAGAAAMRALARLDDVFGRRNTFLDVMVKRLLQRVSSDDSDPLWAFLREVERDQGAIIQLTPESMHLFNAAVVDREGLHYASVVTAAPPPPKNFRAIGLAPSKLALGSAFAGLYALASRVPDGYPYPHQGGEALVPWLDSFGLAIEASSNDGVVPTLSQVYGEVVELVMADHLDVVGQFPLAGNAPHSDWLPSGSGFDEARFVHTWQRIADVIEASAG